MFCVAFEAFSRRTVLLVLRCETGGLRTVAHTHTTRLTTAQGRKCNCSPSETPNAHAIIPVSLNSLEEELDSATETCSA